VSVADAEAAERTIPTLMTKVAARTSRSDLETAGTGESPYAGEGFGRATGTAAVERDDA
jgi:hypothetical protein